MLNYLTMLNWTYFHTPTDLNFVSFEKLIEFREFWENNIKDLKNELTIISQKYKNDLDTKEFLEKIANGQMIFGKGALSNIRREIRKRINNQTRCFKQRCGFQETHLNECCFKLI